MKRKHKRIKEIAEKILTLEHEIDKDRNVESNKKKIEILMNSLSIEDMLEVDDYIFTKELTK